MTSEVCFAYGSNLHPKQMSRRCPSAQLVGRSRLDRYELGFTRRSSTWGGGVADLVPCPAAHVWGALYKLSTQDLDALDAYEGVPTAYKRQRVSVVAADGTLWQPWAYVVVKKAPYVAPAAAYMRAVIDGAREVGLPAEYIALLEAVPTAMT